MADEDDSGSESNQSEEDQSGKEQNSSEQNQNSEKSDEHPQILALDRSNFRRSLNPVQLPTAEIQEAERAECKLQIVYSKDFSAILILIIFQMFTQDKFIIFQN